MNSWIFHMEDAWPDGMVGPRRNALATHIRIYKVIYVLWSRFLLLLYHALLPLFFTSPVFAEEDLLSYDLPLN
jgi:hypothetical protein